MRQNQKLEKRKIDIVVISDVHLGTFGCRAKELYSYLKSIEPKTLILNGDIIDIWQFRKSYFPKAHFKVLKQIFSLASHGTEIHYLTGNHDEMLRKFSEVQFGNIHLADKLIMQIGEKKLWFFHGDIFDNSISYAKWIAKLGGWGYDFLIMLNSLMNWFLIKIGKERYSFSKKIKNSVKKAVSYINDFETIAAELAIDSNYDYVICGHIHQPQIRTIENKEGSTVYMNSGDWIENLTSLEYSKNEWKLYHHIDIEEDKNSEDDFTESFDISSLLRSVKSQEFNDKKII